MPSSYKANRQASKAPFSSLQKNKAPQGWGALHATYKLQHWRAFPEHLARKGALNGDLRPHDAITPEALQQILGDEFHR